MSLALIVLALGFVCAAAGGELFLRALTGLARAWRLSAAFVGASIAAWATSSPELSVAVSSALASTPEIALGNCIGGNVVNMALILGGALLFGPLRCSRESMRRDLPMALLAPVLAAVLAADGSLSRFDGMLMLTGFIAWVAVAARDARTQRLTSAVLPVLPKSNAWLSGIAGLLLLIAASKLIVSGALAAAAILGWSPFAVATVIVAVGTSTPEIVTILIARLHGEDDIGLGTLLGSNVFNLLFIVGVAAVLHPIQVVGFGPWIGLAVGVVAIAAAFPGKDGVIGRGRGVVLLACYAGHVGATVWLAS